MKNIIAIISMLILTGCSANVIVRRGENINDPNAPINEKESRGGIVRYGYDSTRSSAYKQMRDYCGGDYRITGEESRREAVSGYPWSYKTQYVYVNFECLK